MKVSYSNMEDNEILPGFFLHAERVVVSKKPMIIHTVLGSCVSVCLWDKENKWGGINHYMLPYWNGKGLATPRFGNIAIDLLVKEMLKAGSRKINIIAKVFGGSDVLQIRDNQFNIGQRNIELAYKKLKEHSISVVAESVGGDKGRKIHYNVFSGQVFVKYVG